MAIDFPNSPSNGDIHTVSGKRWQWDGEKWQAYGASLAPDVLYVDQGNARVGINDTTPSYSLDVTGTAHVTGAITAPGGVVGNVTGNASGTALTVTQAAQSAITSLGTLTGLTVSGDIDVDGTTNLDNVDIDGTVQIDSTLTVGVDGDSSDVKFFGTTASTGYLLWDKSQNDLIIGPAGSVGIGETAPASDLVVRADSAAGRGGEITILNYATSTVGNEAALNFGLENSTYAGDVGNAQIKARLNATSGAADLIFSNYTGGAFTEHLRIMADGKVGIGTASPGYPLETGGDIRIGGGGDIRLSDSSAAGTTANDTILYNDAETLSFWVNGAARAKILSDGTVSIGKTSNDGKNLEVYQASNAAIRVQNSTTGTGAAVGLLLEMDGSDVHIWNYSNGYMRFGTNDTEHMRITSAGNVGIGTNTPTAMLHIVDAGYATRMDRSGYDSYGWVHSAGGGIQWYNYTDSRTEMYYAGDGRVAIGTTTVTSQVPSLTLGGTGASEGGQLNFAGGSSYGNDLYLDRYGNNLRMIYNGASVFEVEPTGSLTFLDTAQLKCGSGNDLLVYANGSNSFIDHNGDGDLWIRTGAAGEHMYFNTLNGGTGSNILFQRNSVTTMELRYGATTHEGSGNNSNNTYGAVGFAAAGVYLDRHWLGNPGFTVCNANAAGNTAQGTFRFHGSDHTYASYPSQSGSDFNVNVVCDGTFSPTSDERRKTDIEDITGALAIVNALQGRTYRFKNSALVPQDPGTIGGKLYGLIAQEAQDFLPHAIWDDGEEPLENGWCRSMRMDYGGTVAVLVEAIKELTTRLEALEAL